MADILLKYLPDLLPASTVSDTDLLHLNSQGQDHSITIRTMMNAFLNVFVPVGTVHIRTDSANPNTLFPGTTWARLPAALSLRTASESGDNVMRTTGSDQISIGVNNLPAHSHAFTGTAASAGAHTHSLSGSTSNSGDHAHYINLNTNAAGNHVHNIRYTGNADGSDGGSSLPANGRNSVETSSSHAMDAAGSHAHNVSGNTYAGGNHNHSISGTANSSGAHTHSVSGTTNNTGNGEKLTIVSASLYIAAWRRTA